MKRFGGLFLAVAAVLILAGCGQQAAKPATKPATVANGTIRFAQQAQDDQAHVWLEVGSNTGRLDKDSTVNYVVVTQSGKAVAYQVWSNDYVKADSPAYMSDWQMKDIRNLSSAQIIARAKKADRAYFNAEKAQQKSDLTHNLNDKSAEEGTDPSWGKNYDAWKAKVMQSGLDSVAKVHYQAPTPIKLSVEATTDGSGNTIIKEATTVGAISFGTDSKSVRKEVPDKDGTTESDELQQITAKLNQTPREENFQSPFEQTVNIYDRYYTGYNEDGAMFVTRAKQDTKVAWDKQGTKGVHIAD